MKKSGFTLVELIATIVILAIIALIAVPIAINQVDETRKEAYEVSVRGLFDSVNSYLASNNDMAYLSTTGLHIPDDPIYEKLNIKNAKFVSGRVYLDSDQVLHAQNLSDGNFCANGTKSELSIFKGNCDLLDETAPELTLSINRITSSSITVAIDSFDEESGIINYKYYLNGSLIEENKNNIYTFRDLKADTEYKIEVRVENGNHLESNKDTTVRTTGNDFVWKQTPEGWSRSKTITLSYPAITGLEQFQYKIVGTNDWVTVSGNKVDIVIEKDTTITARILKEGTQIFITTRTFGKIDREAPIITEVTGNNDKWTTSKRITITAVDNESGLANESYSFDGGNTWQKSSSKTFTSNGTINIVVKDKVGNISEIYPVVINKIDPTIPKTHSITATVEGQEYTSGTWTNKDVVLKANPSPSTTLSGYTYKWYKKSGNSYKVISGETGTTLTISSEETGTYKVEVITGTGAGPVQSSEFTLKIDKTAPTCKVNKSNKNTTTGITATFMCTDEDSGVTCIEPEIGLKTSGSYDIIDNAGNKGTCSVTVASKTQYRKRTCSTHNSNGSVCGYSCGSGYSLSGTTCTKYSTSTVAAAYNGCATTSSACVGGYVQTTGYGQCAACGADYSRCKTLGTTKCGSSLCNSACFAASGNIGDTYYCNYCASYYYAYCNSCPVTVWSNCASTTTVCNGLYYCADSSYTLNGTSCTKRVVSDKVNATAKSCSEAGCKTWGDYNKWSDSSSNYCSNSNTCEGETRLLYY